MYVERVNGLGIDNIQEQLKEGNRNIEKTSVLATISLILLKM